MITYRQQWEIVQEIKKEPKIKKKYWLMNCLGLISVAAMIIGGIIIFATLLDESLYDKATGYSKAYHTRMVLGGAITMIAIVGAIFSGSISRKIVDETREKLQARIVADADKTDKSEPLSDAEKIAYFEEKQRQEATEIAVMKQYYTWGWAACAIPLLIAFLCLLFIKGISFLGLGKMSLYECFEDFFKSFSKVDMKPKATLIGSFLQLGATEITGKMLMRWIAFGFFIFVALDCVGKCLSGAFRIVRGQANIERTLREKDQKVLDTWYMNAYSASFFSFVGNVIRWVISTAFKGVALLAFPIMFFDYIEQALFITEKYMIIIPIVLLALDAALRAGKQWYTYKNKEVLQVVLPLFYADRSVLR